MRLSKTTPDVEYTVQIDTTNYETHFTPSGEMVIDFTSTDQTVWFRVETNVNQLIGILSHHYHDLLMSWTREAIWVKGKRTFIQNQHGKLSRITVAEWRYPA